MSLNGFTDVTQDELSLTQSQDVLAIDCNHTASSPLIVMSSAAVMSVLGGMLVNFARHGAYILAVRRNT